MPTTSTKTTARPKGGRHTDVPGEERCKQVIVRMTVAEQTALRRSAATAGLSVSEFVRRRTLGIPVVPPKAKGDAHTLTALNAVGNNLNQLTKRVHAGDVRDITNQLDATLRKLRETLDFVTDRYLEE